MSGQQPPPYGQGPPPYGHQPPSPPGAPPGPPPGQWQELPGQPPPDQPRRSGSTVLIAALATLVVGLGALSAYLWFVDGGEINASTDDVSLPEEIGDFTVQKSQDDSDYSIDIEETREKYEEIVGAAVDNKTYELAGSGSDDSDTDPPTVVVTAVRADLPLTPGFSTEQSSTEVIRDNLICQVIEDDDSDDENDDEPGKRPESCSRTGDGMTVYVNTYSSATTENAPTVDELVEFTDDVHAAVK